ncbi:hypothetical protein ABZV58_06700 [Nocardia sp. NPDC004654]|uniref:hypothetical protein n=1 Tax=Nocardia sp. NPDC004654 TaxID=3154776 RepID=UPI0033A78238
MRTETIAATDRHPTAPLGLRRVAALTAAALTTMSATVAMAPAAQAATVAPPVVENVAAATAVAVLTAHETASAATIPDDFITVLGYRPVPVHGLLTNPGGDCSSPVPLPAEFETACKAHDLGYDLLRYADRRGEPLGPWARQAVDAALDRRMREACDARTESWGRARCYTMADIADTVVDLNSRRQHYGAPVVETMLGAGVTASGWSGWLVGLAGLGALGLGTLLALVLGALRRASGDRSAGAGSISSGIANASATRNACTPSTSSRDLTTLASSAPIRHNAVTAGVSA